jgi:hypothetical protein
MNDGMEEARKSTERAFRQGKRSVEHAMAETENMGQEAQEDIAAATRAAEDIRAKLVEFMMTNMSSTLDYAKNLASVKSPSEFMELSANHARTQFEAISAQTNELATLTQQYTVRNTERLTSGFSRMFNVSSHSS